ncbi:N-acetyltransferase [Sporomusa sphaeroides]|uniref:Amino-acid acetyltransferase n=2 Tax=Sporomusa TaxID=2375 RepID=A0ABP2C7M8_9FIRM|nr:N-acetyltransferase [Sporomusa sphaeroides]OLS58734.1 amino-acid acetyltransferase [Sporomusa sphaeroides DSM 2875]CVK19756.1 Amino-acid acetyltransferase [Sporomusa sphaeroides DSM 2875]SCM79751.1 putative enzyme [uncultured Sporomusa sp.]
MIFRKATFSDVESILKLINEYAQQGLMLARSRNTLYEGLREFVLAEEDGKVVGVAALHLVWDELAEIRALAVHPSKIKTGIGRTIVEKLTEEAKELGVKTLFALTYQPGFFRKLGFKEVEKDSVPQKMWKECINCPKFPNCDEIAMVKEL